MWHLIITLLWMSKDWVEQLGIAVANSRRYLFVVEPDIIIQLSWQIERLFSTAKHSLCIRLGRYVEWEGPAKGCWKDVWSCYCWDARPSRKKWPKSWYFWQMISYFGLQLYHGRISFVGRFLVIINPQPSPTHSSRFRMIDICTVVLVSLCCAGASYLGHPML